jgi:hypothetical protein
LLFRTTREISGFGNDALSDFIGVLTLIKEVFSGKDPKNNAILAPGKLFVFGSSSGGRASLEFIKLLIKSGFTPYFVASIDATFFPPDTISRPNSTKEPVEPVPRFNLDGRDTAAVNSIAFERRLNFYQRQGNHAKSQTFGKIVYTSKMKAVKDVTEEIHGEISIMKNENIIISTLFDTDDRLHEQCDVEGRRQVQEIIAKDLKSTPKRPQL